MPIPNTFVRQYRTRALAPSGLQVQSCTFDNTVHSIGQALAAMGDPYPASQFKDI